MPWIKKGFVYGPKQEAPWMQSYAQVPTALVMDGRIRVYITVRPQQTMSLITFVDLDIKDPSRVLHVHTEPLLAPGAPGTFDEFGIMPAAVTKNGDEVWLYTTGWQRGQTVPYLNAVGLAISRDGGTTFTRPFAGPVLSITPHEPYSAMSPSILRRGDTWQMWYGSGTGWAKENGKYEPVYSIYYAHSSDGISWHRPNICCIPGRAEEATTRPCVIFDNGQYHMWFSCRKTRDFRSAIGGYRIGYASSPDGISWQRDDARAGITVSQSGWDSEMIAYPNIVDTPYGRYLFHNGNGHGKEGFGYAVWSA